MNTITHNGFRAGFREAKKAASYYVKNTAKYYKSFIRTTYKDLLSSASSAFFTSSYMKQRYKRLFR